MIRLALRQFRAPAWTAVAGLVALAAVLLATRPQLTAAAAAAHRACGDDTNCPALVTFVHSNSPLSTAIGLVVLVVPALVGAFWGAPLVAREFEAGTHKLVWTQSVSRTRWLAVKLAVAGTAAVVLTGLVSVLVTWWAEPLDEAAAAVYATFDQRDVVPMAYALFAFTAGMTLGLVTRRTLPAMAMALGGLLAVRIVVTQWVRPLIAAPEQTTFALDPDHTGYGSGGNILLGIPKAALQPPPPDLPDAWIRSTAIVDGAGRPLTDDVLHAACPGLDQGGGGGPAGPVPADVAQRMHDCVAKIGETYHQAVSYQPGDRYWMFQWWELGVFAALSVLLCAYAFRRLHRHGG
ncbi:MAG: ABC transporter permease [Hamadaea sp.]|uniref:ABC transporter permease subunit n=1 Tax=Hamadaea sp. TaxID=2024425 RepID=UPI00178D2EE8|nr:ABC transporter permease subunit [Hamadaea sp.]NUR69315.1 ABC transporter permease [Hamadaea sp.]NUT21981.1 ABC transporter permease [Hamadaea sp.]